jgi:uncharacterized membrane protein YfhO
VTIELDDNTQLPAVSQPRPEAPAEVCRITNRRAGRVELEAQLQAPGVVVLSDLYCPGWVVEVATHQQTPQRRPILRANRVMRGVPLPAGQHRLVFRYAPSSFAWACGLSAVSWLMLVSVAGWAVFGRARRLS